jgi:hypothetical protein
MQHLYELVGVHLHRVAAAARATAAGGGRAAAAKDPELLALELVHCGCVEDWLDGWRISLYKHAQPLLCGVML